MSQIRALLALASGGSFVVAALSSGLSQPSLHRAVRDVERLSGVVLVERRGRGVGLTPGGHRLARGFNLAINETQAALDELHALTGVDVGRIRIGAMPLARARLLPMAIARYHRQRPTVTIEVVEGPYAELLERLRDGGLDFLIGALRQPLPGPDVEQEPLFDDRLVIVAGSRHPLAGKPDVSFEALTRYPWVIGRAGTPLRRLWRQLFESRGLKVPPAPIVCGSVMTIRTLLMEGDFLTLLSPIQIRDDLASGALAAIGDPIEETLRPIGLTIRADWRPAPAQREFLELLRAMIAERTIRGIE
jgi:DNA-binding transcriptional LysR family regulator